jgi:hypothetical protein
VRVLYNLSEHDVVPTSSGVTGMDVQLSEKARGIWPFAVECKNHARLAIYRMWEQATSNGKELYPLLVVRENRAKEVLVIMSFETFEELLKKNKDE